MRILITGGAGFIGSELACLFRQAFPAAEIVAMDNLRRRGSELNVARLREHGVTFVHGDVRQRSDVEDLPGNFDVMIEASAEPSVQAGLDGSPDYAVATNLIGTIHCLSFARARVDRLVFLSTSRVYSMASLRAIALDTRETRFEIAASQVLPGVSERGIAEEFPTHLPRSIYGATKLASEMLIQEYAETYGLRAVSNRCGVIAGPGQFGNTGQGVFTLWVARHHFGLPLTYTGFGGQGLQVRDLLHPADLFALILRQLERMDASGGESVNVGGGREISTSLAEFTAICREVTGRVTDVRPGGEGAPAVDVPLYVSDSTRARQRFDWEPRHSVRSIVQEIHAWLQRDEAMLRPLFV